MQDRIRAVNTCIQHGLSVQDLTVDSNRIINNNKRYYCASKYEIENLSKPAYDYAPEVLRLTGLARYDGLEADPDRADVEGVHCDAAGHGKHEAVQSGI